VYVFSIYDIFFSVLFIILRSEMAAGVTGITRWM
jgi:hypothetical protein